jgi:uncharacterized protein
MRIIRRSELAPTPWKNGAGVTREIAAVRRGEAVVWRLSMADVASDGPFSNFAGLIRVLTVIDGNGMELITPTETLYADYGEPVRFDGALKIEAKLIDGPLRDLNLFFDPLYCEGKVVSLAGPYRQALRANPDLTFAVHGLRGDVMLDGTAPLRTGDTALIEAESVQLDLAKGVSALLISLARRAHTAASKSASATR